MLTIKNPPLLATALLAVTVAGAGCSSDPETPAEDVAAPADNKSDGAGLRFEEMEPNDEEEVANVIDDKLQFGKMTRLTGSLKDWDDDYFQLTNADDKSLIFGFLMIDDIDMDVDIETGLKDPGDDFGDFVRLNRIDGGYYFQFRDAGTARIHLMSIAAERRHEYVLMLGKVQIDGASNPTRVTVGEIEGEDSNDDWPMSVNVVPNFWTQIDAELDYTTFDRDRYQVEIGQEWVLYASALDGDERDFRRFEIEVRTAVTDELLGRIDDDEYFRLTSDEPVIFTVVPNPGIQFEAEDPMDYKLELIRIRKGSEFEFPTTL